MFATGDLLRSIIREQLSSRIVYPNKIEVKIKEHVKSNLIPEINKVVRLLIQTINDLESSDGLVISVTVKLGQQRIQSPGVDIKDGVANLNFECDLIDFSDGEKSIEIVADVTNIDESLTSLTGGIDVKNSSHGKTMNGNYQLTPSGSLSASLSWFKLSCHPKDIQQGHNKSSALLEVFIDSPRKLPADKKNVFVKLSIADQIQETLPLTEDSKSWKKHFAFFLHDPYTSALKIQLIDHTTLDKFATFEYKISDLMGRKQMQHDLQAFPFLGSHESEIVMSFKLRALKASN